MVKICIDAGHGGRDNGATGYGLAEKDVALDIAKRIAEKLKNYQNVDVLMTRMDDHFVPLSDRVKQSNDWGADYFVSIHNNAFDGNARGYEDFIFNGQVSQATVANQNVMHESILNKLNKYNVPNRGKKQANFAVLRGTRCPAILTENLFIDNKADNQLLRNPSVLDDIAQGHVDGFVKIFGLKKEKEETDMHEPSNSHKKSWEKATEKGVFNGKNPKEPITREQVATVLDRVGALDNES